MSVFFIRTIVLFFIFSLSACGNKSDVPDIPKLELSQKEVFFKHIGGQTTIELIANGEWSVPDLPDWIELDKISGVGSGVITLTVFPNEKTKSRDADVNFLLNNLSGSIKISQEAKEKSVTWSCLGFSFFEQSDFTFDDDQLARQYQFATTRLLITQGMKEQAFLGNLLNRKLETNTKLPVYDQYTFVPITVSPVTIVGVLSETFIPSFHAQEAYAAKIVAAKPNQQLSLKNDLIGIDFDSYRELRLIGEGNLGVKLDELISGKSYTEQEMTKSDGFIFSYDQTKFAITMDLQEKMVEEVLKVEDFPAQSLSYISEVSYGRVGLLIVETDHDLNEAKVVVRKKLQNTSADFSEHELSILNEISVYHVYMDQSQCFVAKKGKAEIITDYLSRLMDNGSEVYPYKITVSDYFNHAHVACSFGYFLK